MNLFLLWLLQHYIIAIFTCGLKDNLAHGVGNPVHGKARLLSSKHANVQNGDESNLMESGSRTPSKASPRFFKRRKRSAVCVAPGTARLPAAA
jgi:hypothetical protein